MTTPDDLLYPAEVARMLRVNTATVRIWTNKGLIPAVVLPGGQRRYRRGDITEILTPIRRGDES